jgi:hypothetical protein
MRADFAAADKHFTVSFQMRPDTSLGAGVPTGVLLLAEMCKKRELPVPLHILQRGSDRVRVALFLAGTFTEGHRSEKALPLYDRVLTGDLKPEADGEQVAYALCFKGEAFWRQGKAGESQACWSEFQKEPYSRTLTAPRALLKLGCTKFTQSQKQEDLLILEKVYTQYATSEVAPEALFQHACTQWARDPWRAIKMLETLRARYPKSNQAYQVDSVIAQCRIRITEIEEWRAQQRSQSGKGDK